MAANTSKSTIGRFISSLKKKVAKMTKDNLEKERLKKKAHRIELFKKEQPKLSEFEKRIVDGLEKHGTFITTLDELKQLNVESEQLLKASESVMPTIQFGKDNNIYNFIACAKEQDFEQNPIIGLWGLHDSFIRIATGYIGLPVAYRGLLFRRDVPNKVADETRKWHVDGDDDRIMKIIVYLNDIEISDGPYEYISKQDKTRPEIAKRFSGRVSDEDMTTLVPEDKWKPCVGKKGTVVFTDPCSIYHRGKVPTSEVSRFTLFYAYNSVMPSHPDYTKGIFSPTLKKFLSENNQGFNVQPLENSYQY